MGSHIDDDSSDFSAPSWSAEELNTVRRKRLARRANCFTECGERGRIGDVEPAPTRVVAARLAYRQFQTCPPTLSIAIDALATNRRRASRSRPSTRIDPDEFAA